MNIGDIAEGGVTSPRGFRAGAVYCGIKASNPGRDDMALVVSDQPSVGAAVFTTNRVKAAPVRVSQAHLRSPLTRAVLLNSGNANACTGVDGVTRTKAVVAAVARAVGVARRQVLVCSTGRIGVPLPVEKMTARAAELVGALSVEGGHQAATAIMTSDTFAKQCVVEVQSPAGSYRVGGMAKGAGMIDPNMATMLCVLTTDAMVGKRLLQETLHRVVERSFNRITVDGDMSTNDTVIALANGAAGLPAIEAAGEAAEVFAEALHAVCLHLAHQIVFDGEGVSKFVEVQVRGAASFQAARRAAEAVANSTLVKCAWAGGDPNWGRIMDALGYSGVRFREEQVDIYYDGLIAARCGTATATPVEKLREVMAKRRFAITIDLHQGPAFYAVYTTDLTADYVRLNLSE